MRRLVLAAALIVIAMQMGCPQKQAARASDALVPNQVIEGFKLIETLQGKIYYELQADTARVYEDSNRIEVINPRVKFYDEKEALTSTLTAEAGTVNTKTSDLVARRNVRVETRDSTILKTDSLAWRNKDRVVATDAAVDMHSPKGDISGVGLVSDAGLKRIDIKNTVQATTNYDFKR